MPDLQSLTDVKRLADAVRANVGRVIIGKEAVVDLLLVALLSDGHVLLEDVPGMGKTVLAKSLARSLGATFQRVQGTPDLLPTDVTGVSYYDQKRSDWVFRQGPIFAQVVLFDEINRATPRTQSALLEAMAERQVTVERESLPLPRPFLVLATQNPVEMDGTFPLPEAQLDRFLLRLRVGYPTDNEELAILHRFKTDEPLADLVAIASAADLIAQQQLIREAKWQPDVERYLLAVVRATREHPSVEMGASPRATLALYRACQALAAIYGREYVEPDDVKRLAQSVLAHRLILTTRARLTGQTGDSVIAAILAATPAPVENMAISANMASATNVPSGASAYPQPHGQPQAPAPIPVPTQSMGQPPVAPYPSAYPGAQYSGVYPAPGPYPQQPMAPGTPGAPGLNGAQGPNGPQTQGR